MKKHTLERLEEIYLSWIGTPYMHMCIKKGRGADCAKFLAACYQEAGIINFVDDTYYSKNWMLTGTEEHLINGFHNHFSRYLSKHFFYEFFEIDDIENFEFMKGDILCFNSNASKLCHHAAIYHENMTMIHCTPNVGVKIAQILFFWKRRMKFVFRVTEKT